jgi:hypothetical protein
MAQNMVVWALWTRQLKYLINAGKYLTCPPCNWPKRIRAADAMIGGKTASELDNKVKGTSPVPTHSALLRCSSRCMWSVMFVIGSSKIRTSNLAYYTCTLMLINAKFPFYRGTEVEHFRFWSKFMCKLHCFSFRTDFESSRVSYSWNEMWVW